MHVILGATGRVGSATADTLLRAGEPVTVVTRDEARGAPWRRRGAAVAVADIHDVDALRAAFRLGRRAFLLNPPADPSGDADAVERETARCILAALDGSGLEGVVAQSTYGAQPGERIGDLGTLFALEEGLRAQAIPAAILRAAYHMSNWDALLDGARETGLLPTMLPAGLALPMVSAPDLGRAAARLLCGPAGAAPLVHVEGPRSYAARDVAAAFAQALGRPVEPAVTPREDWEGAFRALGFSAAAARSYARMTAITADGLYEQPEAPERATVTLEDHVRSVVGEG